MCRTVAAITVYWTGRFTRNRNLSTAAAASRKVTCVLVRPYNWGQEQTMAGVMTMRSGNPALTADTFAKYQAVPGTEQMTLGGTVNKTALSLAILLVAASYVWNRGADNPSLGAWIMISVVAGFLVALV